MTTHADQRGTTGEPVSPQRLAALLLVAALLPAVVASWSAGPIGRVQTALVEASRAPHASECGRSSALEPVEPTGRTSMAIPAAPAPVTGRMCEALTDRLDLCATPPPAIG